VIYVQDEGRPSILSFVAVAVGKGRKGKERKERKKESVSVCSAEEERSMARERSSSVMVSERYGGTFFFFLAFLLACFQLYM